MRAVGRIFGFLGEIVVALLGTFAEFVIFSAALAILAWGWQEHPVSTVVLITGLGALLWFSVHTYRHA